MEKRYLVVRINLHNDEICHFVDRKNKREAMKVIKDSLAERKANNNDAYKFVYEIKTVYANKP